MLNPEEHSLEDCARNLRRRIRSGEWSGQTAGALPDALQCNLAIVPGVAAEAFHEFCNQNPKPCPLIAKSAPGERFLPELGLDLDVATDVPAYRIFRNGEPAEKLADLTSVWRDDLVTFAIGCSFSFEAALARAGISVRHVELGKNVAMYVTSIDTVPVAPFAGPMVVSMRPIPEADVDRVIDICARYPFAHGAPVHVGDPAEIGIGDLSKPDFGDAPDPHPGEVPVFWGCGVTPLVALRNARLDLAATHEPGHMLVTDLDADAPSLERWRAASPEKRD